MTFGILIAIIGLMLVVGGIVRRPAAAPLPPSPPMIPTAKIEDGRPLPSSPPPVWPSSPLPGQPSAPPDRPSRAGTVLMVTFGVVLMGFGGCVISVIEALRGSDFLKLGRPYHVRKRVRLGRRARGTGWHDQARPCVDGVSAWRRARLGEQWLAAARAEHASVPAFQRLEAQLVALQAPLELVHRCRAAADDEVRHARRCFAIARTYAGIDWTAGALPAAAAEAPQLTAVAVESLVDGCAGEGIAADLAQAGADEALDPVIRESLAMIARDEAVHAELAWDVLAFCLERGGSEIETALIAELPRLRCSAEAGPTGLVRARCQQIARARVARVRERLSTLIAMRAETN